LNYPFILIMDIHQGIRSVHVTNIVDD